jgi:hypothetical protein
MPEYWLDSDSFIESSKRFYHPDIVPGFWAFLEQKADEGIIGSCLRVYEELQGLQDELSAWATKVNDTGFFVAPDPCVQAALSEIADHVKTNYPDHNASEFLNGADPWPIAHAKAHGGRVVTFEKRVAPTSKKPKIPNVADRFGVKTLDIYRLLHELGASFG